MSFELNQKVNVTSNGYTELDEETGVVFPGVILSVTGSNKCSIAVFTPLAYTVVHEVPEKADKRDGYPFFEVVDEVQLSTEDVESMAAQITSLSDRIAALENPA